jgi:hypothetical protein
MTNFKVKTESLAVRCEICHQADLFEPATGVCTRCAGIEPPPEFPADAHAGPPPDSPRFPYYTGPQSVSYAVHLRNLFIGMTVGSAPALLIPFLLLVFTLAEKNIRSVFYWSLVLALPANGVTGILIGNLLRFLCGTRSETELRNDYGQFSTIVTLAYAFLFSGFLFFYQGLRYPENPRILEMTVFGFILNVLYFGFFNEFGSAFTANVLKWLERHNLDFLRERFLFEELN